MQQKDAKGRLRHHGAACLMIDVTALTRRHAVVCFCYVVPCWRATSPCSLQCQPPPAPRAPVPWTMRSQSSSTALSTAYHFLESSSQHHTFLRSSSTYKNTACVYYAGGDFTTVFNGYVSVDLHNISAISAARPRNSTLKGPSRRFHRYERAPPMRNALHIVPKGFCVKCHTLSP
eukprot:6185382-Pleurochrysis_carterae.AAC.4